MPIEPPDQKFFDAARGYAELGMYCDANEELEKIDPFLRAAPEVLALRIEIYRGLEKSELMREVAKKHAPTPPGTLLRSSEQVHVPIRILGNRFRSKRH